MNRFNSEFSPEIKAVETPSFTAEQTDVVDHNGLDAALPLENKNQQALEHWSALITKVKNDVTDGYLTKEFARTEVNVLLRDLAVIKQNWSGRATPETLQKLESLIFDLKQFRKKIASFLERARGVTAGLLVGLGVYGAAKGHEAVEDFNEARSETMVLASAKQEFVVPALPESVLVAPEKVSLPSTSDLFRKFASFVTINPEKGLDLAIEEKEPGLVGVYLKFGHQIDRSVNFSDKFLPEISRRLQMSEADLKTAQNIFHDSVYEEPPAMAGFGTTSVYYSSENILKLDNHQDFYTNQVGVYLELLKQKIPTIESAPKSLQTELVDALAQFIKADLAVRAYDERIKDAIKNQREFELEGVDGTYEDAPSLFARQEKKIKAREAAIGEWYNVLAKINPAAADLHSASQLAVRLQGWQEKRSTALSVSRQEADKGVVLSSGLEDWNEFVKTGDAEFINNAQALKALLSIDEHQSNLQIVSK